MGRKKKVDRDTARQSALSSFWIHGYTGLGVRKLEELTGINRFALQTEFGGKNGLFLQVAEMYVSAWRSEVGENLRKGNLDDLADFFVWRTQEHDQIETNRGCLIFNTLDDEQPDTPEIRQVISGFLETIQTSFAAALENEGTQGTLTDQLDMDEASQMLLSALIGMNMLIRQKNSNEAARATALGLQKTIMSWRVPGGSQAPPIQAGQVLR